jgi:hypothetical protein
MENIGAKEYKKRTGETPVIWLFACFVIVVIEKEKARGRQSRSFPNPRKRVILVMM